MVGLVQGLEPSSITSSLHVKKPTFFLWVSSPLPGLLKLAGLKSQPRLAKSKRGHFPQGDFKLSFAQFKLTSYLLRRNEIKSCGGARKEGNIPSRLITGWIWNEPDLVEAAGLEGRPINVSGGLL